MMHQMKLYSQEYLELKKFFEVCVPEIFPNALAPDVHPVLMLDRVEKEYPSIASKSLMLGIKEIFIGLARMPQSARDNLDDVLAKSGCLSISEVMARKQK